MLLRHILAATDESDAGRQAVRAAAALATRASARLTVLRVRTVEGSRCLASVGGKDDRGEDLSAQRHLRRWLEANVLSPADATKVELATTCGIPGIEICRFAEQAEADLLVLGRKRHSPMMRLLLGDTADAVARRSRIPCMFVPPGPSETGKVLVALDGGDRGMKVLKEACDFARYVGAVTHAVTVERRPIDEPLQLVSPPLARSASLEQRVREVVAREGLPGGGLSIRQGDILDQVIAEVQETETQILAIGYHRGGPPGVLEAGSTGRRLAHVAPCSVLTVPL